MFTEALILDYDEQAFSASGLTVRLAGPYGYHSQWRYGVPNEPNIYHRGNLGGTARTLDMIDGACALEDGLVATNGYAVLPDDTIAMAGDWVAPRIEGNIDTYYFGYGYDAAGAVRDFYRLTGPQPLLPRWALGNWWSRYYAYSADRVPGADRALRGRGPAVQRRRRRHRLALDRRRPQVRHRLDRLLLEHRPLPRPAGLPRLAARARAEGHAEHPPGRRRPRV